MDAGVPADAVTPVEPPAASDPAADVGVSLADLRVARDAVVGVIEQHRLQVVALGGRKAALDALIAPLEAELAKPKRRPRR